MGPRSDEQDNVTEGVITAVDTDEKVVTISASSSTPKEQKEKTPAQIQEAERMRLAETLFKKSIYMVDEYRALIKHTGGLLTSSMVFAYSKGLQDSIKAILKENQKNG